MIGGMSKLAKTEQHLESCWRTPKWLVDRIRDDIFGGVIDLDPCTDDTNPTSARRFYTPVNDGILQPWYNAATIYVNPPYGKTIGKWVTKAVLTERSRSRIVVLVPARTDSKWAQLLLANMTNALFFRGRLSFELPGQIEQSAPFPSMLVGLNVSLKPLRDLGVLVQAIEENAI